MSTHTHIHTDFSSQLRLPPPVFLSDFALGWMCVKRRDFVYGVLFSPVHQLVFLGASDATFIIRDCWRGSWWFCECSATPNLAAFTVLLLFNARERGIELRKRRAKRCPPWWLLFLCVFVGLALAQWSTAFKWATRECLNGEAGGVLVCVCVCLWRGLGWGNKSVLWCSGSFPRLGGFSWAHVL